MFWSLSLQLMPGEAMVEESKKHSVAGIQPVYSVHLTNKRVMFRFDSLGSSMTQSFLFEEIVEIRPAKRLLIVYLELKTAAKTHYLNISDPAYWSTRIPAAIKSSAPSPAEPAKDAAGEKRRQDLQSMLTTLRTYNLLSDAELADKRSRVESLRF